MCVASAYTLGLNNWSMQCSDALQDVAPVGFAGGVGGCRVVGDHQKSVLFGSIMVSSGEEKEEGTILVVKGSFFYLCYSAE